MAHASREIPPLLRSGVLFYFLFFFVFLIFNNFLNFSQNEAYKGVFRKENAKFNWLLNLFRVV